MSTTRTALRAWVPAVDLNDLPPGPLAFVPDLAHKLAPSGIGDALAQTSVADKVLHCKGFCADNLVLVNQSAGQLVEVVHSAISNSGVDTSHLALSLGAVCGAQLFTAESALRQGELGGVLRGMPRVAESFALAGDEQVFDAQINADRPVADRKSFGVELTETGNEVPAGPIHGHSDRGWLAGKLPAHPKIQRLAGLGKIDLAVPVLEPGAGELSGLPVLLRLESRVLRAFCEKVLERCLLVSKALLKGNAGHIAEPRELPRSLDASQFRARFDVSNFLLSLVKRIGAPAQDLVINKAHTPEGLIQKILLLIGRIKPVLVCTMRHV